MPTSFTNSLVGKESICNVGDSGSIPGSGRSPGEGIGYPLQYSWASLVAQLVKNPPANAGDLGSIPGLGRSPGEGKAYHSSILAWRISWTVKSTGSQRVGHDWAAFTFICLTYGNLQVSVLLSQFLPPFSCPCWDPQVCSLCLRLYFCPVNRLVGFLKLYNSVWVTLNCTSM